MSFEKDQMRELMSERKPFRSRVEYLMRLAAGGEFWAAVRDCSGKLQGGCSGV